MLADHLNELFHSTATIGEINTCSFHSPLVKNAKLRAIEKFCRQLHRRIESAHLEEVKKHLRRELVILTAERRKYAQTAQKVLKVHDACLYSTLDNMPANFLAKPLRRQACLLENAEVFAA